MKIALMQPYLFPYLGYFQLINSVDFFGIYDDVQFIERGWINRNRILTNNGPLLFSFSLKKKSYKTIIKERYFHDKFDLEKEKFLRILYMHYRKAPYYQDTINIIKLVFENDELNVSKFNENQLRIICDYLQIDTKFLNSNLWKIDKGIDNQERLVKKLDKLKRLKISFLINPIGGKQMYSKEYFKENNYELTFLRSKNFFYKQFGKEFIPDLSIIDVMMFNNVEQIKVLLKEYTFE